MILKSIHIDGFGIFNNHSLKKFKPGLNIIYGKNEAGKSTLLKFIRYTLFGYPRELDQRMAPLRGGEHGGRVILQDMDGKEISFERMAGAKGGQVQLLYQGRISENENEWYNLLGNATDKIYQNIYSFSLEELAGLESLQASGVEEKLFSAGLGLKNTSLGAIENNIRKHIDSIYKSGGKVQEIPKLITEINQKKHQIANLQENLPAFEHMTQRVKGLYEDIKSFEASIHENEKLKKKYNTCLNCYESFVRLQNINKELDTLPELQEYPEDGLNKLNEFENKEKTYQEQITNLEQGISRKSEELGKIIVNKKLLEKKPEVEYLRRNIEKYKDALSNVERTDQKIKKLNEIIKQDIIKINANWSEKEVMQFKNLLEHKDKLQKFIDNFNNLAEKKRVIENEVFIHQSGSSATTLYKIFRLIGIIFLILSFPAFYYNLTIAGISTAIIALLLIFYNKISKSNTNEAKDVINRKNEVEEEITIHNKNYEAYLKAELNLPSKLSPEYVKESFRVIEHLNNQIIERNELEEVKRSAISFMQEFDNKITLFKNIPDLTLPDNNDKVQYIISEFENAVNALNAKNHHESKLIEDKTNLEAIKNQLKDTLKDKSLLIADIQARGSDDFKDKYRLNARVTELTKEKKQLFETIDTIAGLNRSDEIISYLNANDKSYLESGFEMAEKKNSELKSQLESSKKELYKIKGDLERLEGESELSQLLTELSTLKTKLSSNYKEWLTGSLALKVFNEVKQKYEKEKQPEVIRAAGRYFEKITNGKYKKIGISLETKSLFIIDSEEKVKTISQLSRGTKEQLLICMRLAFIEEYEKNTKSLPIIADEVLVNFDQGRARATAEILYQFSLQRQILLFTCQPSTIEYFKNLQINKFELASE